jgi:hypothetical protein
MGCGLLATGLLKCTYNLHFLTGPIKIQSDSIMVRYFFADCHLLDPTRIMEGNIIAYLKYYNEGIVSHINLIILIYLRSDVLYIHLFLRNTYRANSRQ